MAWFACMQDVLPVLTGLNVLFQSSKPLPYLLFSKISSAKSALITQPIPIASVDIDTSLGAFANKFIRDHSGDAAITGTGGRLTRGEVLQLKNNSIHCMTFACSKLM